MLDYKEVTLSHFSFASFFLMFNTGTLCPYWCFASFWCLTEVNFDLTCIWPIDTVLSHGKTFCGFDVFSSSTSVQHSMQGETIIWLPGWLNAKENSNSLFLTISPGEFLFIMLLFLHATTLIMTFILPKCSFISCEGKG